MTAAIHVEVRKKNSTDNKPVNPKDSFTPEQLAIVAAANERRQAYLDSRRKGIRRMAQNVMTHIIAEQALEGVSLDQSSPEAKADTKAIVEACIQAYDNIGDVKIEDRTYAYPTV